MCFHSEDWLFCLFSVICRNGALAGINFIFAINPEFVCRCVMWKVYVCSVLVRCEIGSANLPGEKRRMEMTWWVYVAGRRGPS